MFEKPTYEELEQAVSDPRQSEERNKVKESLRESEYKLATHLQNTPIGALSWDLDFKIIEWNPAAENIFGFSKAEAIGRHATELILPEEMKKLVDGIFRDLISEKGGSRSTNENRTKSGRRIICDWYNTPLKDFAGKVVGIASMVHDVTERNQSFDALRKQKDFNEKIVQTSNAIIVGLDNNHKIKIFNKGAEKITGYKAKEMIGKDWFEIFFEPDIYDEMSKVWEAAWGTEYNSYVNPILSKNGAKKIISWQSTGIYDDADVTTHMMISIGEDITERTQTEEKERASQDFLDKILNNIGDPVFVKDGRHRFTLVNDAFCSILGLSRDEVIGKTLSEDLPPDEMEHFVKIDRQVLTDGQENLCEELLTVKSRETLTIVTKKTRYVSENGDKFLVGVIRDITERKQAEEERRKLETQLQHSQKMEAIGTLAGGIAHDFNNILSAILGYSQFVKKELPDGSPADKDIDMVIQSSMRAADLVKQILTFSRKTEHQLQALTPHPIIKEALLMLRSTLPATIEIKQDIDKECGNIEADPTNIHQIMVNLCSNALHAMDQQKGTLTVRLSREDLETGDVEAYENVAAGSFVVFSVSDTGHGMDTKTMQRVFEPYFTTKEVGEGSGIGLAVIHGIVQDYKGFVRVVSTPGQGSTFSVYLPLLEENAAAEDDQVTPQKNEVSLPQGSGRILVVDDEELLVRVNKRRLEYAGYTVTATTNSEEALEKIRAHPEQFDLLITDQTMPNMSGVELTREVHKINPDMPVIMSTGHSDLVTKEEALEMGISKYVVKPIQGNELLDAVGEVLDEK